MTRTEPVMNAEASAFDDVDAISVDNVHYLRRPPGAAHHPAVPGNHRLIRSLPGGGLLLLVAVTESSPAPTAAVCDAPNRH
jgi:hypothetical protein